MATITRGENGLLVDGEPFDPTRMRELTDEELEKTTGGVTIYTKYDKHWYGSSYSKLKRNACGSLDWTITGWYGANYSQYGSGKEYMLTRIEATCDKCGSHNVDRHFMRMISKDAFG